MAGSMIDAISDQTEKYRLAKCAAESALASATRELESLRSAAVKRFPGTEPPDSDREVLARFGEHWEVVFYSLPLTEWVTGGPVGFLVPDEWQELPPLEGEGGKT